MANGKFFQTFTACLLVAAFAFHVQASYWSHLFAGGNCGDYNCTQKYNGKFSFDTEVRTDLREGGTLAIGAINIFDAYPDRMDGAIGGNARLINRGFFTAGKPVERIQLKTVLLRAADDRFASAFNPRRFV
ncbi:MAG: hypothetical protein GKS04_00800 [Candidatus Mycalebacterium zealandia]|nr:MAG: hypothetical protein GKS04_00800 [Candidatus Mycalebacterium zealandia]